MYLMVFDVKDSKQTQTQISDIISSEVLNEYIDKYQIAPNLIEIAGGHQLRIMSNNP